MNYKSLSKTISYALRHAPWKFELELDQEGWVETDQLLFALNENTQRQPVSLSHIQHIIDTSEKKRFEIKEDKIRATYGHSLQNKIKMTENEPPEILYHGTAKRFITSIREKGLIPKGRQYVHLSSDRETAVMVGSRRDKKPVILKIAAQKARRNGVLFYEGNDKVWLADAIEAKYIDFGECDG